MAKKQSLRERIEEAVVARFGTHHQVEWANTEDIVDVALSQVEEQIKRDADIAKEMIGARRREIAEAILAQLED